MAQSIENKALYRIRGSGEGWAFALRGFLDLGNKRTVDSTLRRLVRKGSIRRVVRGVYDYPRFSEFLKQQPSPDVDQVARAMARKFRWRIQPSSATALNLLGLLGLLDLEAAFCGAVAE